MTKKAKKPSTITIKLPSGRCATIDKPAKAKVAECANLSLLGSIGRFRIYELADLTVVLVEMEVESLVKRVGKATLATLFETTDLTPEFAVQKGMAKFVHTLPESGFYVLEGGKHVWTAELPQETVAEEKEDTKTETENTEADEAF